MLLLCFMCSSSTGLLSGMHNLVDFLLMGCFSIMSMEKQTINFPISSMLEINDRNNYKYPLTE